MKPEELKAQIRKLRLKSRRMIHTFGEGTFRTIFHGRGIEFASLREYVPGDDIRQIEWNTTARRGSPYVKTFIEERDLTILLLVDLSSSMDLKKETVANIVALLSYLANTNDDRLGILGFTDKIEFFLKPSRDISQPEKILHLLLTAKSLKRKTSISQALLFLRRVLKKHAILFLISDFLDRQFEESLAALGRKHELVGIHVQAPVEAAPLPRAVIDCFDPESGKGILLDAYDTRTRKDYETFYQQQNQNLTRTFGRARGDLLPLLAGPTAELKLIQFLQMRQRPQRQK